MSEEAKIFRGDQGPEAGAVEPQRRVRRVPPKPAAVVPPAPVPEPTVEVAASPPPAVAAPVPPVPEPELNFNIDESQLWHASELVKKRISDMAAAAHQTAHTLDEQAEEAARIAKQLKSL